MVHGAAGLPDGCRVIEADFRGKGNDVDNIGKQQRVEDLLICKEFFWVV